MHHAHLFSLHDVAIACLFSSGPLSHVQMIGSFHSLHICLALFDKLISLGAQVPPIPMFKSYHGTNADYYSFFVIVSSANYLCWNNFAFAGLFIPAELSGTKGHTLAMRLEQLGSQLCTQSCQARSTRSLRGIVAAPELCPNKIGRASCRERV